MAHVRKGQTVPAPQHWKHLRDWKRFFWKKQRKAFKRACIACSVTTVTGA